MDITEEELAEIDEGLAVGLGFNVTPDQARRLVAAVRASREGNRSPCGCPNMDDWEWLDPCPCHVWTHWHPHGLDALREFRLCFYCGVMETQTLS